MPISNVSANLRAGICTSTTRPTSPYAGQQIYETDTGLAYIWSGSAWVRIYTQSVTTKGDVATYSTVPDRLAVGTNNHTLIADSSAATGLRWSSNPVVCTSSTRPSSPYNGMFIYETDTNMTLQYRTSSWVLPWEQRFARTTLTNSTSTQIDVANIPQYGNTLHFRGQIRSLRAGFVNTGCRFRFNYLAGGADYAGSIVGGGSFVSPFGYLGQHPAAAAGNVQFGTFEGYVPDYATNTNSSGRKTCGVTGAGGYEGSCAVVGHLIGLTSGIGSVTSVQVMDDTLGYLYVGSYLEVWIGP